MGLEVDMIPGLPENPDHCLWLNEIAKITYKLLNCFVKMY
jgi:hypothetical protein